MTRKALIFLALTFGLTWGISLVYFGLTGETTPESFALIALILMFIPAASAVAVQNGIYGQPLADIGFKLTMNRWFAVSCLAPVGLVLATIIVSALVPGARLTSGVEAVSGQLEAALPPEEAALAQAQLEEMGAWLPFILLFGGTGVGVLAGATINAIPALGEELGWRGLLQEELASLGFWRSSVAVGVIWGIWHAPLILRGYNYPENPVAGVFMMIVITVLLSPIFAYVRTEANTVLAAAVIHGVYNALAGLPLLVVAGGTRFSTGMTGAAGAVVLLIANVAVFVHRRQREVG